MAMEESILDSVKKNLGIPSEHDEFDIDIITHINSTLFTLNQLGIGPEEGFMIEDNSTLWAEFIGVDINLNAVRSYIYTKVRLIFDPPATSFAIQALERIAQEFEWRLNVYREEKQWPTQTIT